MSMSHFVFLVVAMFPTFVLLQLLGRFSASFQQLFAAFKKRHFDDFSHLFSELLQVAHRMGILKLGTVRLSVDGSKFKANASKLKSRVHKIIDQADKTDAKENTEQGKANDYINHPEDSEQDFPESQANKIKKAYQAICNEEAGSKNPEKKTNSEVEGTDEKSKVLCTEQGTEQGSEQDGDQKDQQPPICGRRCVRRRNTSTRERKLTNLKKITEKNRRSKKLRSKTKPMSIAACWGMSFFSVDFGSPPCRN